MPRLTLREYGGILCNGGYVVVIRSDGNRVVTLRGNNKCPTWRCAEKYAVAEDALLLCAAT
jgi:nitrite reductase/ring-hydroxylating ferredoxin subunit